MKMRVGLPGWQVWRVVEAASRVSRLHRSRLRVGSGSRFRTAVRADSGMASAEYAMGTLAACGFAAVLYKVVTSGTVAGALESVIGNALDAKF
ncbi:DUF4244 domain-containing protein [Streptomyces sp. NPDC058665]|uniref:DUF4244 domain-containing protein n=1 Tax=Streptomyces sp. NPDC058665 TaxID=3346586 RepID=UPI00366495B8